MFQPGQSGNPGGRRKSLGLSKLVRKREGLKTWKRLLELRDMSDIEPKDLVRVCQLILAYTWGQPVQTVVEERVAALEETATGEPNGEQYQ